MDRGEQGATSAVGAGRRGVRRRGIGVRGAAAVASLAVALLPGVAGGAGLTWTARNVPAVKNFPVHYASCSGKGCVVLASECAPGGCGGLSPMLPFSSANDGVSWSKGSFPAGGGGATSLSCGSPTFCVASGIKGPLGPRESAALFVTTNAGRSFTVHPERDTLAAVACGTAQACVALGTLKGATTSFTNTGLVTSDGGRSWTTSSFPPGRGYVESMSCGAPTDCVAVGSNTTATSAIVFVSSNVGRSWTPITVPASIRGLGKLSCDRATCIALGGTNQIVVSKNGGRSWVVHPLPTTGNFDAVSCMSATVCVLAGDHLTTPPTPDVLVSHNGGASWAPQALPHEDGTLFGATCEPTVCVAVGARYTYQGGIATAEFPLVLTG
jgi:photosystem II stability/assembly factor-like uncharacterized protein